MIRVQRLFLTAMILSLALAAQAGERVRRNVEIEWEAVNGATAYEVQVILKGSKRKEPLRFKKNKPAWSATIKPGVYDMQVRSYDRRGVPGAWSPPSELVVNLPAVIAIHPIDKKVIESKEEEKHPLKFSWEPVPGAGIYKIKAQSADGSWKLEEDVKGTSYEAKVPVGTSFTWTAVAVGEKGESGDAWENPQSFEVHGPALKKPRVTRPMSRLVRELRWDETPYAKKYKYTLKYYDKKTKKWSVVDSKEDHATNKLPMDVTRPSGRYSLEVQAIGEGRAPSSTTKLGFDMEGGFKGPESFESAVMRYSLTKPTRWYAIGSYMATQVTYDATNFDTNTRAAFDTFGSTARVGLGYQADRFKWGGFVIADMSQLGIGGKDYNFTSLEFHANRGLDFGQTGLLMVGGGVYSKELPVILGTATAGYSGAGKISGMGPHAGFTYWQPFSERYGMQINGRVYYSMFGSTPSGDIEPAMSFQYGILGSYRIGKAWMGYVGYTYRADHANFKSNPDDPFSFSNGQSNEVNYLGHYLNLSFEYSF